eukprot:4870247-Ditylum_brightwellii.AAC.1
MGRATVAASSKLLCIGLLRHVFTAASLSHLSAAPVVARTHECLQSQPINCAGVDLRGHSLR